MIVLSVMVYKEYKKQLPTAEEKQELINKKLISSTEKDKKVIINATYKLRQDKLFIAFCRQNGYHR